MKYPFIIFSLFISMNIQSQQPNSNQPLPENSRFVKGVLRNGLTYYIYPSEAVKGAASYYIISNAGSILEEDNQSGLAHFLEHMAFNGTKNFPEMGILNTLQKYGALFGKDINANTNFDKTIYLMSNIPTKDGMVDTCLMILHDWANEISLIDEEIDKERGVIKEEWRTRRTGRMRIFEKQLPAMFINTKYAKRLPIGSMDVVEHFKHDALRKFYHDWYRTDLQAIAVIGDVDVKEIEQKIKKIFSPIPAVKNPKKRYYVEIPENKEMLFTMATDKEISTSNISFSIHFPKSLQTQTVGDLKNLLLQNLFAMMINARFEEQIQNPENPISFTDFGISSLSRTENNMTLMIGPKPGKQYEAFTAGLKVLNQAVRFGFTRGELERTILSIEKAYETQISQIENVPHILIENVIENNYLENKSLTDISKEYEIAKQLLDQFTPQDVQNRLKELYTQKNRVLLVTGVEGEKNLNRNDALKIIRKVENDPEMKAYKDSFEGKSLLSGIEIKPGKIVSEKSVKEVGATEFVLSNGVKVFYKFADKEKNRVQMVADSDGGFSLIKTEDIPSAGMITSLADLSGLGNYSRTDITKILAGNTAYSSLKINDVNELVMGSSDSKDVETMLQLTYLRFVKPRFSKESYDLMIHDLKNSLLQSKKNIQAQIADSVTINLFGKDNPKKQILSEKYISQISFEKIKKLYHERFKDPADFKFFIIGDIQKEELKPLLEKYIASLPTYQTKETWKDNYVPWIHNHIDKDIFLKMENPKTTVRMQFEKDLKWSLKNKYLLNAVKDILQLRLNETLREEEGGTYGAVVYASMNKRPRAFASIGIVFDCNPEMADKLVSIVYKEIDKLKKGQINQADLDKTLTNYRKIEKQSREKNDFDLDQVYTFVKEGYNIANPENTTEIFNQFTIRDIQNFAQRIFSKARNYEFVFKPKE